MWFNRTNIFFQKKSNKCCKILFLGTPWFRKFVNPEGGKKCGAGGKSILSIQNRPTPTPPLPLLTTKMHLKLKNWSNRPKRSEQKLNLFFYLIWFSFFHKIFLSRVLLNFCFLWCSRKCALSFLCYRTFAFCDATTLVLLLSLFLSLFVLLLIWRYFMCVIKINANFDVKNLLAKYKIKIVVLEIRNLFFVIQKM